MTKSIKPALIFGIGLSFMFPSFNVSASSDLLENFTYPQYSADIEQNTALALMEQKAAIVIDVRTKEEYEANHIEGAYNIPLDQIAHNQEIQELKEKNIPILLYCRSGNRSGIAMKQLENLGYKRLMNFGGVITWQHGFTQEEPQQSLHEAIKEIKPLK